MVKSARREYLETIIDRLLKPVRAQCVRRGPFVLKKIIQAKLKIIPFLMARRKLQTVSVTFFYGATGENYPAANKPQQEQTGPADATPAALGKSDVLVVWKLDRLADH